MAQTRNGDEGDSRLIYINHERPGAELRKPGQPYQEDVYTPNRVITSQYTVWNFVPKNLLKQFQRLANIYFLCISGLQMVKSVSITQGVPTTLVPLSCVLFVTALKDVLEDLARHKADTIENNRATQRLKRVDHKMTEELEEICWKDVKVGDVLKIQNREQIPADVILLASSDKNGLCYVMTANLDGETNLKQKQVHPDMLSMCSDLQSVVKFQAIIECDKPNRSIQRFEGTITQLSSGRQVSVNPNNVLLRGTQLRNTSWILGVVVYTGKETKIQMNAVETPFKMSRLTRFTNKETFYVFVLQIVLCFSAAMVGGVLGTTVPTEYLGDTSITAAWQAFLHFWTYIILFTNFIPISLLVTLDMVKFLQSLMINNDIEMYHAETDNPVKVRSSDLNEELGMVEHIFCDKTGTLTCNVMEFRKCSINGVSYGIGTTEIGRNAKLRRGIVSVDDHADSAVDTKHPKTPYVNCIDENIWRALEDPTAPNHKACQEFFLSLALNHSVMPEIERGSQQLMYSASSPDENALVWAARHFGFFFQRREITKVTLVIKGVDSEFIVLNTLEFTSARKRSSVIIRRGDGSIVLYCKGADSVIRERVRRDKEHADVVATTEKHLIDYAEDGLRTLCLAKVELSEEKYNDWARKFHEAEVSMENREQRVTELMDSIETDMTLLGVTAIEDKLQKGVSTAIQSLRLADIRVWVLTGDRVDTAINIGLACGLLTPDMKLIQLICSDNTMHCDAEGIPSKEDITTKLKTAKKMGLCSDQEFALVVDSGALEALLRQGLDDDFIELSSRCKSVICARVSPNQKGEVVNLVKHKTSAVTLAVGDGANDVPMIQCAHVGVGIVGQEGLQAVNASDFSIAQFRFLERLLLVHGRWSLRRLCKVTMYMFYKNALLVLPQFYYGFRTLFSGQNFYNDYLYQLYNVVFTAFPVILMGVLDQDVNAKTALKHPQIYSEGVRGVFLNHRKFWAYMVEATVNAGIVFLFPALAFGYGVHGHRGKVNGMWDFGIQMNFLVVMVAHLRIAIDIKYWIQATTFFFAVSVLMWLAAAFVFSANETLGTQIYNRVPIVMSTVQFWATVFAVLMTVFIGFLVTRGWKLMKNPEFSDHCREEQEGLGAHDDDLKSQLKLWKKEPAMLCTEN